MFLFKKLVALLFYPVSIAMEAMLFGLFLLWFTRKQKTGKVVVSIGVGIFALFSYAGLSNILLRPLEYKYPPIISHADARDAKWVVVLGGGHTSDPQLDVTSQIGEETLARLVEGIRLHKMTSGSKLILSGGGVFDPVPNAKVMADVASVLGVERRNIVLESISKDTKDEARIIKKIVGNDRFLLVTSAAHMLRSMALFEKKGMRPIPSPAAYRVKESKKINPGTFFPDPDNLVSVQIAIHEYLGMAWAKIRGQI